MTRAASTVRPSRASEAYSPDAELVEASALKFRWNPKELEAALSRCGELPFAGQRELIDRLISAYGQFQRRGKNVRAITPIQMRQQLDAIEMSARRLLGLLGVSANDIPPREYLKLGGDLSAARFVSLVRASIANGASAARHRLAMPEVSQRETDGDDDSAVIRAALKESTDHLNNAIVGVCWIYERAKAIGDLYDPTIAADPVDASGPTKRGGARNVPTQKGQVVRDALAIYVDMRQRYPDSGKKLGLGAPMRNFVRAVGALFGAQISDSKIDEVWRTLRRGNSNPK